MYKSICTLALILFCIPASAWGQFGEETISPRAEMLTAIVSPFVVPHGYKIVCPDSHTTDGTDVSKYDPKTSWGDVKRSGRDFAFIKATEGLNVANPWFATDWMMAKLNGLQRGPYHFFHPKDNPTDQANFFLDTVGDLSDTDLPPLFDWEVTDGQNASVQINNAKKFLQLIEAATGKVPVLYFSPAFFNQLGNPKGFERYPLFIANYEVDCPAIPPTFENWAFWQQGQGRIPGIQNKTADIDVFNGDSQQLASFANRGKQ